MTVKKQAALFLSELHILILSLVLVGAFTYQFTKHELPCPLCFLQRIGMIAMAAAPMYNLFFGFNTKHFALGIVAAIFSGSVSIRQILLHISLNFPTFGEPVFGLELYTWAFVVAVCSLLGNALLLILCDTSDDFLAKEPVRPFGYFSIGVLFLLTFLDMVMSFFECGFGYCPDNPVKYLY